MEISNVGNIFIIVVYHFDHNRSNIDLNDIDKYFEECRVVECESEWAGVSFIQLGNLFKKCSTLL